MKIEIDFDSSFEDGKPIPVQLGRLYLGQHVVRLAFTPDGRVVMMLPKAAIDSGHVIVVDVDYKNAELIGFGYPPSA